MTVQDIAAENAFSRAQLAQYWTIIGSVLLVASIAQPIASAQLADLSPEELLATMTSFLGDAPLPEEIVSLFGGVFANIEFAFAFAALKLMIGAAVVYAARRLLTEDGRPQVVLKTAAVIGMAAFIGIGSYFAYSSFLVGSLMDIPLVASALMAGFGLVVALLPTRWLWRNVRSLRAL